MSARASAARYIQQNPSTRGRLGALLSVAAVTASLLVVSDDVRPAAAAPSTYSPYGHVDTLTPTPGGMRAVGWAVDPSSVQRSLRVYATVDGKRSVSVTASRSRPDVAQVHRGVGPSHGFAFVVPAVEGRRTVCIWATNLYSGANTQLACRTLTLDFGPHGKVEYVRAAHGGIAVKGWVVDGDAWTAPVTVRVTIDSATTVLTASRPNSGVPANWPTRGSAHGFAALIPTTQGAHRVCITAKSIGAGRDNSLGCRSVTLDERPSGHVDVLAQQSGRLRIQGWTYDPDSPKSPLRVTLTIDGHSSALLANRSRPDVAKTHPSAGALHGFDVTRTLAEGIHTVRIVAGNIDLGSDRTMANRSVRLNFTPSASMVSLTATSTGVRAQGWAIDPDTTQPIKARLTAAGTTSKLATANHQGPRGAQYPGRNFGEYLTLRSGTHTVCAVGVNVLYGTHDSAASCRTITLALSPHGHYDTAARVAGSNSIRITGWAFDWDTSRSIPVAVSLDGKPLPNLTANVSRPDVSRAYPGASSTHGFSATLATTEGEHRVCTAARNVSGGKDVFLGCKIVNAVHPVAPGAPRTVKATGGYQAATVTWTRPVSDGGAPWTKYIVMASAGGRSATVGATATRATVTGLKVNTAYSFTVRAVNVAGASAAGKSAAVRTQAGPALQRTPAPVATSRYLRNIRTASATELKWMRAAGASDAGANPSNHRYMVLLDIGGQDMYGGGVVLSATTRFVSYANLVRATNAYVDGYRSAQRGNAPATIAVGTNNDMDVSSSTGKDWAIRVVNPVASHARNYSGIRIAGANDVEPGFRATYSQTRSWLSGYLANTSRPFVFNGSADGCAWTTTGRRCNNGWTMSGLYTLAAGAAPTRVVNLPQVYNTTMSAQWKYISLTGVVSGHKRINFGGPLTELTACRQARSCGSLSGRTAWTTMWGHLQSDSRLRVSSLPYATDLRIDS